VPGPAATSRASWLPSRRRDGYTLLVGSAGGLGGNLSIYRRMPYDPFKDLTPIAQMVIQGTSSS